VICRAIRNRAFYSILTNQVIRQIFDKYSSGLVKHFHTYRKTVVLIFTTKQRNYLVVRLKHLLPIEWGRVDVAGIAISYGINGRGFDLSRGKIPLFVKTSPYRHWSPPGRPACVTWVFLMAKRPEPVFDHPPALHRFLERLNLFCIHSL